MQPSQIKNGRQRYLVALPVQDPEMEDGDSHLTPVNRLFILTGISRAEVVLKVWDLLEDAEASEKLVGPECAGWDEETGTVSGGYRIGTPLVIELGTGPDHESKVLDIWRPGSCLTIEEVTLAKPANKGIGS